MELPDQARRLTILFFIHSLTVFNQYKIQGQGANLVWSADLGLHYGALTQNRNKIDSCSTLTSNEIRIRTGEGIQPDYSFHQHGPRLQEYHYGSSFLNVNVRLAWELHDTPWQFTKGKIKILSDYVLKSWQWMSRHGYTVPGTIDRAVSRPDFLHSASIKDLVPYLIKIDPSNVAAFKAIALRQGTGTWNLSGFRYFPYSDFVAYHTPLLVFF